MLRDAPPWLDDLTTSSVWRLFTEVNTFTSSGMSAPASVPQEMMTESFHQVLPSPRFGMSRYEVMNVSAIETIEVIQTSEVSGASKSISSAFSYLLLVIAAFTA